MMKLRTDVLPRTITDVGSTAFLFIVIPLVYFFELFVVLPEILDTSSFIYYFHAMMGTFILFNILTNMLAVIFTDTSIREEILTPPASDADKQLWRLCTVCETVAPPRSWHCNICRTCILKRDHHCAFTGCCIGHHNHRFFLMLVAYLFLATTYATLFNNYYFWVVHFDEYYNGTLLLKCVFPLAMFLFEMSLHQSYLMLYVILLIGAVFTGFLLFYHGRVVWRGAVVHERGSALFSLGSKRNIEMVFGKRWYWTWVSPFLSSELPHNGIHWDVILRESCKNR